MPTPAAVPSKNQDVARPLVPYSGQWLWACRSGAETNLLEELSSLKVTAKILQPGLVISTKRPQAELVFARQGIPVDVVLSAPRATVDQAIAQALVDKLRRPFALHVFSADGSPSSLIPAAAALEKSLLASFQAQGLRILADGSAAHTEGGLLAEVCLLTDEDDHQMVVAGVLPATAAHSLYPGGVQRVRRPQAAPSRSAHKLLEALTWLRHGPESGELCVDLGAAPGGWSQVLVDRRCRVLAIDPGTLAPAVAGRVHHLRQNAFAFVPDEPVDWVFCDMAYRPLEVAALLARWGRRGWARFLLANIKLPMKKRVEMLSRVRQILESGGWTGLRARQLYHDRDEVTVFAWRGFGMMPDRVQAESPRASRPSQAAPPSRPRKKAPAPQKGRKPPHPAKDKPRRKTR